jgi:hypothetical protein
MNHRGRIQAQGKKLEESEAWSQNESPTKNDGFVMLEKLKNKIPRNEAKIREKALKKANRFIENGPYQVIDKIISKTFMVADTEHERIDIEIQKGKAFIND